MPTASARRVDFPQPSRIVVVGDLNGDDDALAVILNATGVTDGRGEWIAQDTHLVQLGDIVNRGGACRAALDRMMRLEAQAEAAGCHATMILGNHEAMVALGNMAWCTPEEFLEFAAPDERLRFEIRRSDVVYEMLAAANRNGLTQPITGRMKAWEEENVPGKEAYLEAFGADGLYGRFVRRLPVAVQLGPVVFTHGGLAPALAEHGLETLDQELLSLWAAEPKSEQELAPSCLLLADDGPLWNRRYMLDEGPMLGDELRSVLGHLDASAIVVGHTRTDQIPGGQRGEPAVRFGGRLLCADVAAAPALPHATTTPGGGDARGPALAHSPSESRGGLMSDLRSQPTRVAAFMRVACRWLCSPATTATGAAISSPRMAVPRVRFHQPLHSGVPRGGVRAQPYRSGRRGP